MLIIIIIIIIIMWWKTVFELTLSGIWAPHQWDPSTLGDDAQSWVCSFVVALRGEIEEIFAEQKPL